MNLTCLIIIFFTTLTTTLSAQKSDKVLQQIERFCCYEWLPDFQDSISIIVDEKKINLNRKYCVITKGKRRNYKLYCWIGMNALETPTEWRPKLKIRFKRDKVKFKFDGEKIEYRVVEVIEKEEYLLIKLPRKGGKTKRTIKKSKIEC